MGGKGAREVDCTNEEEALKTQIKRKMSLMGLLEEIIQLLSERKKSVCVLESILNSAY